MVRRLGICCAVIGTLIITASAFAQPDFPANADFADGTSGWNAPEGSQLEADALSLADGAAVSDPSAEPLEGWQRVDLRVKGPGRRANSTLTVALAPAGAEGVAQVALSAEEAGSGWHTLSAEVLPPPSAPASVVIGVHGADRWLIDSVTVTPMSMAAPEESELAATVPDALPEGWEPDGLLDAVERPIGYDTELLVSVGALEVGMPDEVEVPRGYRGSAPLIIKNRANTPRTLTVSVTGPPGFFAPDRTIAIPTVQDTVFRASLQAFFVGTRWARLTFRCGEDEASAPIRVTTTRSYPAPGVSITGQDIPEALIDALPPASIPMVATASVVPLPEHLTRLRLLPLPWTDEALRSAAVEAGTGTDFMMLDYPRAEAPATDAAGATMRLREALNEDAKSVATLSPPLDLQAGSPPEIAEDDLSLVGELGEAGAISAATLRLPVLGMRPARAVSLDDGPLEQPQPAWTGLSRTLAVRGVAAAIRQQARLPMFFSDLAARTTGTPEADAAMLARALVLCAYQGATGWTVPARPQDAPGGAAAFCPFGSDGAPNGVVAHAYSELSRELAAAVPLTILKQSPEVGSAPDAQVGFRPFMRNDEGILAMWNNTGAPIDLIVEVRTEPLDIHTVSVGPEGLQREYQGEFHFSKDAITLNRPVIFVTLEPAQLKVMSMQLSRAHIGWLAGVERKPKIVKPREDRPSFLDEWAGERSHR